MADGTKDELKDGLKDEQNKKAKPVMFPAILFLAEFGNHLNQNFTWPHEQIHIRGRWAKNNYLPNQTVDPLFSGMPDIPGLILEYDSSKRCARIFDPLSSEKSKELLGRINEVHKAKFGVMIKPEQDRVFDQMSNDELKTFAYFARRLFDNGSFSTVIRGPIPEMQLIRGLPGQCSFHNFDQGAEVVRMQDIPARYAPPRAEVLARPDPGISYDPISDYAAQYE